MKRLKQFDLDQLSKILDVGSRGAGRDDARKGKERLVSEYLSRHLLVVRNPPIGRLLSRLYLTIFFCQLTHIMLVELVVRRAHLRQLTV